MNEYYGFKFDLNTFKYKKADRPTSNSKIINSSNNRSPSKSKDSNKDKDI